MCSVGGVEKGVEPWCRFLWEIDTNDALNGTD